MTSDKPQMNTTAITVISDAGAAPVGTNYNVCRYVASLLAPLLWCTMSQLKLVPTYTAWWTEA